MDLVTCDFRQVNRAASPVCSQTGFSRDSSPAALTSFAVGKLSPDAGAGSRASLVRPLRQIRCGRPPPALPPAKARFGLQTHHDALLLSVHLPQRTLPPSRTAVCESIYIVEDGPNGFQW